ncbi:MAG: helix-turn-helix transcriptional regulator [Oscillospiraceae bacterium]|nr:helix-turn-helix transcriptional regulator [Oscillospiraceae bacterium]
MSLTIGQTIKKLRKERNFTQEELAEQLNITAQAVSKWENETGMPDISQIVPIASVFGISADVLFGTYGVNDDDEVQKIIENAYRLTGDTVESKKRVYDELQNGLRRYPNNIILLVNSLERGIALSYPENGPEHYDEIHGEEIYQECIRQANLIISYAKNAGDVLRAHMIMVLLHSAYGEIEKAWEHANKFPGRPDFTIHNMCGYISHAEKNYSAEAYHLQNDFSYHLTAIFDDVILLGEAYRRMRKYDEALKMFFSVFSFMELVFGDEKVMPPVQNTDSGDVYALIAKTYIEMGDAENALSWLKKMVDYDIDIRSQFKDDMYVETPLLRDVKYNFYSKLEDNKKRLSSKLNRTEFDCLKNNDRFTSLLNRANDMDD